MIEDRKIEGYFPLGADKPGKKLVITFKPSNTEISVDEVFFKKHSIVLFCAKSYVFDEKEISPLCI